MIDPLAHVLLRQVAAVKDSAYVMRRPLESASQEWLKNDVAIVSRLLDPCFKDTELAEREKPHARALLQAVFAKYHVDVTVPFPVAPKPGARNSGGGLRGLLGPRAASAPAPVDEVAEYLAAPVMADTAVLDHWKQAARFPTLSRIARDFLSIPASLEQTNYPADVKEKIFDPLIYATLCLNHWNDVLKCTR